MANLTSMRVLLLRDAAASRWSAVCLENSVCAFGSDHASALRNWVAQHLGYVELSVRHGRNPVTDGVPAAEPYQRLWNRFSALRLSDPFSVIDPMPTEAGPVNRLRQQTSVALVPEPVESVS